MCTLWIGIYFIANFFLMTITEGVTNYVLFFMRLNGNFSNVSYVFPNSFTFFKECCLILFENKWSINTFCASMRQSILFSRTENYAVTTLTCREILVEFKNSNYTICLSMEMLIVTKKWINEYGVNWLENNFENLI